MRRIMFFVLCLSMAASQALSQVKDKDLKTYLAGVTERGRSLYDYDQAAWHGTDAILALHPNTKGLTNYVCWKTDSGWMIAFAKWNDAHDKLLIVDEATDAGHEGQFVAHEVTPPVEASPKVTSMERALENASANFPRVNRPYNSAVLPAPGEDYYVYLYPAQTVNDVWPLGGDVRFTLSSNGQQILEKRPLHKTILDLKFPPDAHPEGGFHTHVLSDVPEDTDVLHVLNRKPSIPEYVGTKRHIFIIQTDGSISIAKK